ncbi:MAG: hypothetical protein WBX17_13530 [Microbacterium sp.]
MEPEITATLTRLDEHRIRVIGTAPADSSVHGNGWECIVADDGTFAFNCMAYTNGIVGVLVLRREELWTSEGDVSTLKVGETREMQSFRPRR